jgi:hypothetical protein
VRDPIDSTRSWMLRFSPSMIEATEMTLVTPMTMPSTVRPLRTLCERSVSSATSRFSRSSARVMDHSLRNAATGSSRAARTAG